VDDVDARGGTQRPHVVRPLLAVEEDQMTGSGTDHCARSVDVSSTSGLPVVSEDQFPARAEVVVRAEEQTGKQVAPSRTSCRQRAGSIPGTSNVVY
jgi:hypothetical protein